MTKLEQNSNIQKNEILESKNVFKGKILNVRVDTVILEDGKSYKREIVEHKQAVCILPFDNNKNVYLVSQYRHAFQTEILEAPAGLVETGEDPLICAKRELREEINAEGDEFIYLGNFYPSPGFSDEVIHLYLTKIKRFVKGQPDEDEFLTVKVIPFTDIFKMINNNSVKDAKTIIAVLKANNHILSKGF